MDANDLPMNIPYPTLNNARRAWLKNLQPGDSVISFGRVFHGLDGPEHPGQYRHEIVVARDSDSISVMSAGAPKGEQHATYTATGLFYFPGEDQTEPADGWLEPADNPAARQALLVQTVARKLSEDDR